jgi:hypothetical protein
LGNTKPPSSKHDRETVLHLAERLSDFLSPLVQNRWVWVGMAFVVMGAASVRAVQFLLEVAELPDCWTLYLSQHSPSAQLYCAETIASKRTIEDLQRAISLVNQLPSEDSLRAKGDRLMEQWSLELLSLGEMAFQSGNLDRAVKAARTIPVRSRSFQTAEARIRAWETLWEEAETIYQEADAKLSQQQWSQVMGIARKLLTLGNDFWATTKYRELMEQLEIAQGDKNQPQNAAAAKQPQFRQAASTTNPAETYLARLKREEDATIAARLDKAYALARSGSLADLRSAVSEAQQVLYNTARFDEVRQAIQTWEQQIEALEDRPHLERAIALASRGDAASLQAAIDAAYQIYVGRALYPEARQYIDRWTDQMYKLQSQALETKMQQLVDGDRSSPPPTVPASTAPSPPNSPNTPPR